MNARRIPALGTSLRSEDPALVQETPSAANLYDNLVGAYAFPDGEPLHHHHGLGACIDVTTPLTGAARHTIAQSEEIGGYEIGDTIDTALRFTTFAMISRLYTDKTGAQLYLERDFTNDERPDTAPTSQVREAAFTETLDLPRPNKSETFSPVPPDVHIPIDARYNPRQLFLPAVRELLSREVTVPLTSEGWSNLCLQTDYFQTDGVSIVNASLRALGQLRNQTVKLPYATVSLRERDGVRILEHVALTGDEPI